MKIINVEKPNSQKPLNESFTLEEHMDYMLKIIQLAWRLILRYENPQTRNNKVKQLPLSELSEDDLKRKIVLNICQRIDASPEGRIYHISAEEQLTGGEPDIVLSVRTSILSAKLDIECKKSANNKASSDAYCNEGVKRFTTNKYDRSGYNVGGMIAFAQNDDENNLSKIIELLRNATDFNRIVIEPAKFDGKEMFISKHQRTTKHHTICLQHLVLNCR